VFFRWVAAEAEEESKAVDDVCYDERT